MNTIESQTVQVNAANVLIFNRITDFRNFEHLLPPDRIKNWQSDGKTCSFEIDGIGSMGLKIKETIPYSKVSVETTQGSPLALQLNIHLMPGSETFTRVKITIESDANPLVFMMIKAPLQTLADSLARQLEAQTF